MTKLSSLSLFALTTLSLVACRRGEGDDVVELTADSSTASQAEGSLIASALEGANASSLDGTDVAAFIATHAGARYAPAGCVTATQAGNAVTMVFAGCTGPRGLRELAGTLNLVVKPVLGGAITVDAAATQFVVGMTTLDIAASATYASGGGSSSLDVVTHSTGIGPLGYAVAHDGDYALTWDASCVTIDGAWSTERGDAGRSTTASVRRCGDACPTGEVTRTTVRDRVIDITFDGTDTAAWTTSDGKAGTFSLACGL